MADEPDLPNAWLFWLWLVLSAFWFYVCRDYTPYQNAAYWRETTTTAAGLGLMFLVLPGLRRAAGWAALWSMALLLYFLPSPGSPSVCAFFWIAYYFTVTFSFGSSLTLRKMAKISAVSGLLIGYGSVVDPYDRPLHLLQGLLGWLILLLVMLLVNGLFRLVRPPLAKPGRARLPEPE